jgi:hypothetical protein
MRGADIGIDYIFFTIYVATILMLEQRQERVDVGIIGDTACLEVSFVLVEALEGKFVHDFGVILGYKYISISHILA